MQYIMLIYGDNNAKMSEQEQGDLMKDYFAFTNEVKTKELFVAGEPLEAVTTATTVRVRDGKALTTDGPFAETKETLGGFYILDCENLDQAIEYAAKIPTAKHGSIEVRPIMKIG